MKPINPLLEHFCGLNSLISVTKMQFFSSYLDELCLIIFLTILTIPQLIWVSNNLKKSILYWTNWRSSAIHW